MGEVYRARDTTLHRDVAIKVLPQAFANDSERLARFKREAQTLAALNHPNIAHIHGLEASGGVPALVMELVEGEDLSQRITRGAIPIGDALPIARQVAEALEAAHDQGIVHRDLKPANIMVRPDGTVKVLDFGLAKATEPAATASYISNAATITSPAVSHVGMILGTAAYMSPEQAKGRPVDRRSDLWAFGAVLLEMLTGRLAFKGDDVSDTIASVLTREPDWTELPAETPPLIRRLLRRCLEKDRKRRLDSAADARLEIEEVLSATAVIDGPAAQPTPAPRSASSRALMWTWAASTLGLVVALGLAVWAPWRIDAPSDRPLIRLDVDLGADVSMPSAPTAGSSIASSYEHPCLSPDGKRIAFTISEGGNRDVWLFDTGRDAMTRLTFGGYNIEPKWSPDGQSIVFSTLGKGLFRVRADGASQPQALTLAKTFLRPWSFTPDGKRLAYFETSVANPQILTLPLVDEGGQWKGGQPEPFSKNTYTERLPSFSPDGRWLAYDSDESGRTEVYVRAFPPPASGQGGKGQISNNGGTGARWSRTAPEIVYRSGDQVMAVNYTIAGDRIVAEKPRVWIEKLGGTEWDLAPDGRRLAVLTSARSEEPPVREHEVVFLLNFIDELRRRLPMGK